MVELPARVVEPPKLPVPDEVLMLMKLALPAPLAAPRVRVPFSVRLFEIVRLLLPLALLMIEPPVTCNVPVPKAEESGPVTVFEFPEPVRTTVPASSRNPPAYVCVPDNRSVPEPLLMMPPEPCIITTELPVDELRFTWEVASISMRPNPV